MGNGPEGDRDSDQGSQPTVPSLRTPFGTEVVRRDPAVPNTPSAPPVPIPRETEVVSQRSPAPSSIESDPSRLDTRTSPGDGAPVFLSERPPIDGLVLAERYALDEVIGRGGMGTVHRGRHLTLETPIAVKVMLPKFAQDPHWLRRFEREARATSRLHHRNVVRVLDFGRHDDLPYLVMEWLEGESLADWLFARPAPPSLEEVSAIMLEILDALEAAHAEGIVHRDLKPENVFLATESDGTRVVKVLDFGLARLSEPGRATLTQDDLVSGTPEYMSPEQCRTLKVGPTADIYAMGCLLTEMLQLEPPFIGQTSVDIMTKQMFYEPPALQRGEHAEPVPPLLESLRLDMLAKRATSRPSTVAEVRERLLDALSPERHAELLPERKDAAPDGTRAERALWEQAAPRVATSPSLSGRAGLLRLHPHQDGVDEMALMALRARGLRVQLLERPEDAVGFDVLILDAAADLPRALEIAQELAETRVLVCLQHVSPEAMSGLIAAGAAAVLAYPIEGDKLAGKIRRQLARARSTGG